MAVGHDDWFDLMCRTGRDKFYVEGRTSNVVAQVSTLIRDDVVDLCLRRLRTARDALYVHNGHDNTSVVPFGKLPSVVRQAVSFRLFIGHGWTCSVRVSSCLSLFPVYRRLEYQQGLAFHSSSILVQLALLLQALQQRPNSATRS